MKLRKIIAIAAWLAALSIPVYAGWDGNGTFSRVHDWTDDRDAGVPITASRMDAEDDSFATGLNNTLTRDGQNSPSANLPMAGFRHTGVGNAAARDDYAAAGQVQDNSFTYAVDGGVANNLSITPSPSITAYAAGQTFYVKVASANTGAASMAVSGLTETPIKKHHDQDPASGDLEAGQIAVLTYDGTNFQLVGQLASASVTGPGSSTDNAVVRWDGTGGSTLQDSGVTVDDSDNLSGVATLNATTVSATGTVSGTSVQQNGQNVVTQGKHTIWMPAGAMISRSSSGAASATSETATNKLNVNVLDFDAAADEFAQFSVRMPASWDESDLTAQFVWTHQATATNFDVLWAMQCVAVGDDDPLDAAFGTATVVTDSGGTEDDQYDSPETGAITVAGTPAESDTVYCQVYRDADAGGDTLAIDARLLGATILYTVDEANDG